MKTSRNSPCPCGSGKKFKRCHGRPTGARAIAWDDPCFCGSGKQFFECHLPPFQKVTEVGRRVEDDRREHEARFGKIRPTIHLNFAGQKLVAVGNRLWAAPEESVRTFHDFLLRYIATALGRPWGNAEIRKPFEARHPILQWYDSMARLQQRVKRTAEGHIVTQPDAHTAAYMQLAFDLYAVRHHGALQRRLVERLKHPDHFQGARLELFAAVVCIRAGLQIEHFDAKRAPRRPEFLAVHPQTGSRLAVEAKSRRRTPSLRVETPTAQREAPRANVRRLLSDAFRKATADPLVVFLDVNLPPFDGNPHYWGREVLQTVDDLCPRPDPDPFALLVALNYPVGYCSPGDPVPDKATLNCLSERPRVPHDSSLLLELADQAALWGEIPPAEFPRDPREP